MISKDTLNAYRDGARLIQFPYSVLISVYDNENSTYLKSSLESILTQTIPPAEIVLVCDGPLHDSLNLTIDSFRLNYPNIFKLIRLPNHAGLAYALNIGVEKCSYEYIARMDSDDIAVRERIEKQLEIFHKYQDISIVGGFVEEFITTIGDKKLLRKVPELNCEIFKFSKLRCPFNHSSVMFKKTDILKVGNYSFCSSVEDYDLWVRLLSCGLQGYNIQEVLVYLRTGNGQIHRRGEIKCLLSHIQLFSYMKKIHYINTIEFIYSILIRSIVTFIPSRIRACFYGFFLRDDCCK